MGRNWTPEQKKEFAEKMKLARAAKTEVKQTIPKQPVKLTPNSVEAGVMQPSGDTSPKGQLIRQISFEEAENQLDSMSVDDWVLLHYNKQDFNIRNMSEVLRESIEDIYNRLHYLGVELPQGTYSAS